MCAPEGLTFIIGCALGRHIDQILDGREAPHRLPKTHNARFAADATGRIVSPACIEQHDLKRYTPGGRQCCGMRGDATALVHIAQEVRAVPSRHVPAGRGGRSNLHEMCSHALPEMRRLHVHAFHIGNRLHTDTSAVDCKHAGAARRCDNCLRARMHGGRQTAEACRCLAWSVFAL